MDHFRIQAFFEQFSFLATGDKPVLRDVEKVEAVAVSRIDKDFLENTPRYSGATGSLVGIADSERIYLLDRDGNLLLEVKQAGHCCHNEAHWDDESWSGETVSETLLRTDPTQVHYAVVVHTGYYIQDHYSVGGYRVIIYMPPNGFTLADWAEEQKRRATKQIEAMIAASHAEP